MRNVISKTTCWLLLAVGLLSGCEGREYYNVCVLNRTDRDIDEVLVTGPDGPIDMGVLVKGGADTHSSFFGPVPRTLTVSWRDRARNSHRVQVNLDGLTPRHFRGTIYLKIRPNEQVHAAAFAEDQIAEAAKYDASP